MFSKERRLEGKLSISGAEMLDDKAGPAKRLNQFEEVQIDDEVFAQKEDEEQEGSIQECWVKKTLLSCSLA